MWSSYVYNYIRNIIYIKQFGYVRFEMPVMSKCR